MRTLTAAVSLLVAASAGAETCKYIDAEGHVTYSNVPVAGSSKVSCLGAPPPPPPPAPARKSDEAKTEAGVPTKATDAARKELQARLAEEQAKLADAQRALAEQEAIRTGDERNYQRVLDRLKPYQDAVTKLQQSVDSLQRELTDTR
jgi:hypothetical protein